MAKETDFFKFLKLLRITDFLSKVLLRKYQRNLVPYFKKYQLTGLDDDQHGQKVISRELLGHKTMSLLEGEELEERELSDNKKLQLKETIEGCFADEELEARDLAILYEVTGYQGDNPPDDAEFWANYANYKVPGAREISLNNSSGSSD